MGYTSVFGGQVIYPSQLSLLQLDITADVELEWPLETVAGVPVVASIIQVNSTTSGRSISMPDATQGSDGSATVIINLDADTITIKDFGGNVIGSVASGEAWVFYLDDNTTQAGGWQTFQFGAGTSTAVAAALAGAGLKAITTTLNVQLTPRSDNVSPLVVSDSDRAKVVQWTGGVGNMTLPDPAVVGSDWFCLIRNNGSGNLTITPTAGDIDGSATLVLGPLGSFIVYTDGVDFYTIGLSQTLVSSFDYTTINVAGTGDYTLTGVSELNRISYKFTGVLTGNRNVITPTTVQQYWVNNATSGAFSLTVKTQAGTGVTIPQGSAMIVYCDGTNIVAAVGDPVDGLALRAATVCKSADQGVLDNTETTMAWGAETTDQGGWHDNAVNNSRLTVPAGVHFARFWTQLDVLFDNAGNPYTGVIVKIKKNGATVVRQGDWTAAIDSTGGVEMYFTLDTGWLAVVPGDYFEVSFIADGTAGTGTTVRNGANLLSFFACEGRAG